MPCEYYLSSPAEKGGGAAEEGAAGKAGTWDKTTAACPNSSSRRRPQACQPAAEPADTWRIAAGTVVTSSLFLVLINGTLVMWFYTTRSTGECTCGHYWAMRTKVVQLYIKPSRLMAWTVSSQTLTVTPVLTTKTLPLVLKAAATPALPASVLSPRPPTVAMVTTSITKPESQNVPINLQVASKLTNQSSEPVRLVSKNAMVVSPPSPPYLADSVCVQFVFSSAEVIHWLFMLTWGFCRIKKNPSVGFL